ncbi:hypothetical protein [Tautonia plasticadhaerens]|uniref:Glycosyltransferase RgtA/B/C/D-like domain-containing protein n=1 Tax=Tautonia plasticadhaerens TaxID=2527974 RepID=A0A518GY21_9BACT|nr:hypothetical protein [Tautonia plasticadhaerens]QDV33487.1 hypothetical protein ElP_13600 [Tautonia plasticadhaerens]
MPDASALDRFSHRPDPEPGASWFCWGIWLAMTALAIGFVCRFGPEVPLYDDYALIPYLVGEQAVTPSALWMLHNEHRLPLPKLVLLGAYPSFRYDFRAGMFATVACLCAASALLMVATARARGGSSYSDAFFPVALLNWGHSSNLLWSWQVQFGLSTLLGLGTAALLAVEGKDPRRRALVASGIILAMLPLCGANGLAMVPPLATWLVVLGASRCRSGRPGGWIAFGAALPGVILTLLYFVDYQRPSQIDRATGPVAVFRTSIQFLSLGLGPVATDAWRIGGMAVVGLTIPSILLLCRIGWKNPGERTRAVGLLAVLSGFGVLVLGLSLGRAGGNERSGLESRYITLAVPIPCLVAMSWSLYGPIALRRLVPMCLLAGSLVFLWPNTRIGLEQAIRRKVQSDPVLADLRSGMPPHALAARHSGFLHPSHDELTRALTLLQSSSVGVFRDLVPDPRFRGIPIDASPSSLRLARWDPSTRTIEVTGVDPWVTFSLPERTVVAGIRIRYDHENGGDGSARFKLGWRRSDQPGFPPDQQYDAWSLPTGEDRTMIVWIDAPIDDVRIQPDNRPSTFRIDELTLLIPVPSPPDQAGSSRLRPRNPGLSPG